MKQYLKKEKITRNYWVLLFCFADVGHGMSSTESVLRLVTNSNDWDTRGTQLATKGAAWKTDWWQVEWVILTCSGVRINYCSLAGNGESMGSWMLARAGEHKPPTTANPSQRSHLQSSEVTLVPFPTTKHCAVERRTTLNAFCLPQLFPFKWF